MDTIPPEVINALPPKWHTPFAIGLALFVLIRPAIASLMNGDGLVGAFKSILYGSKHPAPKNPAA